jgi:glycosyltransferase involved in cell wall biosynthesis
MRECRYDVIHTVLPISYLCGTWANRLAGRKPLIMARVSLNWYHDTARLLGYIERNVLHPRVDAVVCNSATIMRELEAEGVPRGKIRVIYNGNAVPAHPPIDRQPARDRLGIEPEALVLSSVGNLWTYKGHADLLHALHKIATQLPPAWALLIVGRDIDGNLQRLATLCAELDLTAHVRFLGELADVSPVLSAADIHVSASHTEGLPNNILEAMGSRLPVVATAVGGVPELVVDGSTGLLVPAHDPGALGNAILALAQDRALRSRMAQAGYERAMASFSIGRSVAAISDVYAAAAAGAGRGHNGRSGMPAWPQMMQRDPAE